MAGACGRTYRIDPRLDPAGCNALTQTPAGLLVPSTALAGIAPGGAVSTARSVDIDVQAPAAGACPATWTIGARMTPVFADVTPGLADAQTVANLAWAPAPTTLTIPEAGWWEYTLEGYSTITGTTPFAVALDVRVVNVTANQDLTIRRVQYHNINGPTNGTNMALQNGFSVTGFVLATRPTVLRADARRTHVGFNDSTAAGVGFQRLGAVKVSD
ncbi:hypothetical protein ABTY98_38790 [Streptomyces sp. NPDC096040]|uniref:hypothetical protein n=1 Tax=Streptomyces sp. NPDC096040 TaxID=3155541 RepID=UPI00332F17FC